MIFLFIIIFSLKGRPEIIDGEDYMYILYADNINIERKLIIRKDQDVDYSAFLNLVRAIEEQYEPHYSVITGIDKKFMKKSYVRLMVEIQANKEGCRAVIKSVITTPYPPCLILRAVWSTPFRATNVNTLGAQHSGMHCSMIC